MHCVHLYVVTMCSLKEEAPRVYYEFTRDVNRVANDKGARFAQEYVDQMLRYLDEKRYDSMVALYKTGGTYTHLH